VNIVSSQNTSVMARSPPTAAGVVSPLAIEIPLPLGSHEDDKTLKVRILSLQPPEQSVFMEHGDLKECKGILRCTMRVITSVAEEARKTSAKAKRIVTKEKQQKRAGEAVELVKKVETLESVVKAQTKELSDQRKENVKKTKELKRIRQECSENGVMLSITDGTTPLGVSLRSAKKKKVQATSAQIRVLLANAEMEFATAQSDEDGARGRYEVLFVEEEKIKELNEKALLPAEKSLYQGKLERLGTDFKNRKDVLSAAKVTTRMWCHRVIDLKSQLDSELN
jgi:hypothetical protein